MKKFKSVSPDATRIIKNSFAKNSVYLNTDSSIVFLCGKKISETSPSARQFLLEYSQKFLTEYIFFLAEDFFDAYNLPSSKDLLSIEHGLTSYSDCIIIVLESESAFAELGAFSIVDDIAKNLIIINDKKYALEESFINLGPIKKINRISKFGKIISTDLATITLSAKELNDKLKKIKRSNRKRIKISNAEDFNGIGGKEKLLLLLDLINIFEPISSSELVDLLKEILGEGSFEIQFDMGLLSALKLVSKFENYYVRNFVELKYYYDFDKFDSFSLKSLNINHMNKYDKHKHKTLLRKIS